MILVDTAEPEAIKVLLSQTTPIQTIPLNQQLMADYYFGGEDGRNRQFCRVQAGELLSNIDSQEDELRRYYNNADDTYLIIEGIISKIPLTHRDKGMDKLSERLGIKRRTLFSYSVAESGWIYNQHDFVVNNSMLQAWKFRLSECGVTVFHTLNLVETAELLASVYRNCQLNPSEHDTLNRYYIPRISLSEKDKDTHKRIHIREQNPFIRALMALSLIYGLDIGEKRATSLSHKYHTLFDIAFASTSEIASVEGLGKLTAKKLQEALGNMEGVE